MILSMVCNEVASNRLVLSTLSTCHFMSRYFLIIFYVEVYWLVVSHGKILTHYVNNKDGVQACVLQATLPTFFLILIRSSLGILPILCS